jgi:hypothetical protein
MGAPRPVKLRAQIVQTHPGLAAYVVVPARAIGDWSLAGTTTVEGALDGTPFGRRSIGRLDARRWFVELRKDFLKKVGRSPGDRVTIELRVASTGHPSSPGSSPRCPRRAHAGRNTPPPSSGCSASTCSPRSRPRPASAVRGRRSSPPHLRRGPGFAGFARSRERYGSGSRPAGSPAAPVGRGATSRSASCRRPAARRRPASRPIGPRLRGRRPSTFVTRRVRRRSGDPR